MTIEWHTQTCLLTGASGGIGREIAKALDQLGVSLWLQGRNEPALVALRDELVNKHHHQVIVGDINQAEFRQALADRARESGKLTMLVNNAGVSGSGLFSQLDDKKIESVIQTNLVASIELCRVLMPELLKQPQAWLVNVGSIFGSIGHPGYALYCASKFGVRGFTEALQREYSDSGLSIHYFAPRATQTAINGEVETQLNTALGSKLDQPAWVAEQLIKQLSGRKKRAYLGFPESLFVRINGLLPALVDNALGKKLPIIKQILSQREKQQ